MGCLDALVDRNKTRDPACCVDFTYLRTFLEIYRSGSLTRAGQTLHMTQPAVSQHLRALEAQVGRPLFKRHSRGVMPTAAGRQLARSLAPHFEAIEAIADSVSGTLYSHTVHIGGAIDLLAAFVAPVVAPLTRGGMRFALRPGLFKELIDALQAEELDAIVVADDCSRLHVEAVPLFEYDKVLVASRDFAAKLPRATKARRKALLAGPFVAFDATMPQIRDALERAIGVAPGGNAALVVPDLRAIAAAVKASAGIAVLPRSLVAPDLESGQLEQLLEDNSTAQWVRTVHVGVRDGTRNIPRIGRLVDALVAAAADRT